MAQAPNERPTWCTKLLGPDASCRVLLHGPLQVHDVISTHADCVGQSIAIVRGETLRLRVAGTERLHGSRLSLGTEDRLVLVQELERPAPLAASSSAGDRAKVGPTPPLETPAPQRRDCGVYWSGFAPYGVEPAPPIELAEYINHASLTPTPTTQQAASPSQSGAPPASEPPAAAPPAAAPPAAERPSPNPNPYR